MTKTLDPVQEYITKDAISYSSLSRLSKGPKAYLNKTSPEGEALDLGKAVDILLTEEDMFHNEFYVMTASKPSSEMMLKYVESMIEHNNRDMAYATSGFKRAVSDDKWEKEGLPYYNAVKASKGKTVLSFEQYETCNKVVAQIKANKYVGKYFGKKLPSHIEIKYQFIYYYTYKGHAMKIKLDLVIIDHKAKVIVPFDLKTTGKPVMAFKSSYRSFKYYLQGAMYQKGVEVWAAELYPEYKVMNFGFIVAEMTAWNEPVIFVMSDEDLQAAEFDGITDSGYEIKGFATLLNELVEHKATDQWDYPIDIEKAGGTVMLETMKMVE